MRRVIIHNHFTGDVNYLPVKGSPTTYCTIVDENGNVVASGIARTKVLAKKRELEQQTGKKLKVIVPSTPVSTVTSLKK